MAAVSPLEHADFRVIEQSLDDGNTVEAAARLGAWADTREHKDAVDFLTTRLLYQRGRIDADGALDRLGAIVERVDHFPEAEAWLHELEAHTERTERSSLAGGLAPASAPNPSTASTQPPPAEPAARGPTRASAPPPPSRAPSIPRRFESHPFVDEATLDDEATPTESIRLGAEELDELRLDSSDPPPRPTSLPGSEPPTEPDAFGSDALGSEPPTRPDLEREDLLASERPTRPSHMPFDHLRAKEQLSTQAGRYRGTVPPAERTQPRGGRQQAPSEDGSKAPASLEQRIREAFERIVQGRTGEAMALLPDEPSPPDLRPAVRAALARALLEIGQAERAAAEASLALEQGPDSAEARLAFVWSAVRYARQRDDAWSLEKAARTLKALRRDAGPGAALLDALGACIEARIGTPAVALRLAQQAMRTDAESIDALAALAEAAALCGEERRAEAALERLYALSESAAEQIAPRLRRLGVGEHGPTSSAAIWLPLEHTLSSGAREVALEGLEALAAEVVLQLPAPLLDHADANGASVARFLALAPVFRHFGSYDLSLASIERLEVGLDLLYGGGPRAVDASSASSSLWQLAGLYLGETLRRCGGGRWSPAPVLRDATLTVLERELQPFQIVRSRIAHGRRATLQSALEETLSAAPPSARTVRSPSSFAPSPPWGDERAFPDLDELPRLGRALSHSVVATYAFELSQYRLDRTKNSLAALDRYLYLVAPFEAPLDSGSPWARWLAVFVGGYLGEVLCRELGGGWAHQPGIGAETLVVKLGPHQVAPVARVHERVCGGGPGSLDGWFDEQRAGLGPAAR